MSLNNTEKGEPSRKHLRGPTFMQESYSWKPSDDALLLAFTSSPCGDKSKYLDEKSASASVSSSNPFCTSNDDNLDGILDF